MQSAVRWHAGEEAHMASTEVRVKLPETIYSRLEQTARLTDCDQEDVIVSALESVLISLPEKLPPELKTELARMMLLDDEALEAIAGAFLPPKRQRRFSTLLKKEQESLLNSREREEWESLKQEYIRLSRNKAKARFILEQRRLDREASGVNE